MSERGNRDKKATPKIEDSPKDITTSPSGSPCTCKETRDLLCPLHGG